MTHFNSFDFSTLYTNIPHDLLLDNIKQLQESYRNRGATYIIVRDKDPTYWSNTMSNKCDNITEDNLIFN